MKRQGTEGLRLSHVQKLVLLAVTALIAFAVPAAANAAVFVSGEDHTDHAHLFVDGDSGTQNITVTATASTVTFTGGTMDSTQDDAGVNYCTGTGPVVCAFPSGSDVLVDAFLAGGADTFDASAATTAESFYIDGGSGADTLTGGPGSDTLYLLDGETDNASTCGAGSDDAFYKDASDSLTGCEIAGIQFTAPPVISGSPTVGSQLSAAVPAYTGGPAVETEYTWFVCTDVAGNSCATPTAFDSTYTVQPSDVGKYIFVEVDAFPSLSTPNGADFVVSDPVQIAAPQQQPTLPNNVFKPGKFAGTSLSVTTPGPGVLTSGPASAAGASSIHAFIAKKKKAKQFVSTAKVKATGAGTFKLPVKLTSAGKKELKKKKKLKVKVKVTFTPTGGNAASKTVTVTFKKKK